MVKAPMYAFFAAVQTSLAVRRRMLHGPPLPA